jgi:hypothetical protein
LAIVGALTPFFVHWVDRGLRQTFDGVALSCRSYDLYDVAAGAVAVGAALFLVAGGRRERAQLAWRLPLAVLVVALSVFHVERAVTSDPECPPVGAPTEPLA